jgi:CDP-diacylglycerol--glycerol-3-phosphate 3-phosphatidyltransferase
MNYIPFALTTLRLLLGPIALLCAVEGAPRFVYAPILVVGTLSDIFDGIIARQLGVATIALRRYDSITDVIYYLFVLAAVWVLRRPVIIANWLAIVLIVASEGATLAVSFAKFRKYPATHSYLAKFYGLCLLGALIAVLTFNTSDWLTVALAAVALITNAEIIAIHLLMNSPPVDVRSVFTLLARKA